MAKTLVDYLGSSATVSNNLLTISLPELYASIFPDATEAYTYSDNPDEALALLVAGIHARNKPELDANGLDVTPSTQALVAAQSFQPKTFVTRGEDTQVQHEFVFNVYTEDTTGFDPSSAV